MRSAGRQKCGAREACETVLRVASEAPIVRLGASAPIVKLDASAPVVRLGASAPGDARPLKTLGEGTAVQKLFEGPGAVAHGVFLMRLHFAESKALAIGD